MAWRRKCRKRGGWRSGRKNRSGLKSVIYIATASLSASMLDDAMTTGHLVRRETGQIKNR
jgi:hypothetical protein